MSKVKGMGLVGFAQSPYKSLIDLSAQEEGPPFFLQILHLLTTYVQDEGYGLSGLRPKPLQIFD